MKYLLLLLTLLSTAVCFADEPCQIKRVRKPTFQYCKRGQVDKYWVPAVLIGGGAGGVIAATQNPPEKLIVPAADSIRFNVALNSNDFSTTVVQIRVPSGAILDAIQLEGVGALSGSFEVKNPLEGTYIMRLIQATGDITTLTGEIAVDGAVVVPAQEFTLPTPSEITTTFVAP